MGGGRREGRGRRREGVRREREGGEREVGCARFIPCDNTAFIGKTGVG